MKLLTPVEIQKSGISIRLDEQIVVLGSCFADNIGEKLLHCGFKASVNPFGTLYNPISIAKSIERLETCRLFSAEECVQMGAGSELFCSFSHHSSFARANAEAFIDNANASLTEASAKWKECGTVIISLGTIYCFRHGGGVVSNCLKRPAAEFSRSALSLQETIAALDGIVSKYPHKRFIFTVSPIRHLADGAHGNQLSKSTLLLAVDSLVSAYPEQCFYFPAYEILMDELRDYRFYAEDMTHPSAIAIEYIWERFRDFAIPASEYDSMREAEKLWKASQHREMHKQNQ